MWICPTGVVRLSCVFSGGMTEWAFGGHFWEPYYAQMFNTILTLAKKVFWHHDDPPKVGSPQPKYEPSNSPETATSNQQRQHPLQFRAVRIGHHICYRSEKPGLGAVTLQKLLLIELWGGGLCSGCNFPTVYMHICKNGYICGHVESHQQGDSFVAWCSGPHHNWWTWHHDPASLNPLTKSH